MNSRQQLLAGLALLAMLIIFAIFSARPSEDAPYDLDATTPNGLRALRLWLQELGYKVQRTGTERFSISNDTDLMFVLPARRPYSASDAAQLSDWVNQGGTLVLIGPHLRDTELIDQFQVDPAVSGLPAEQVRQVQPLLPDSPPQWIQFGAGTGLDLQSAPQAVPVLVSGDQVQLAVRNVGNGVIWYVSSHFDFTNAALQGEEQAKLLPVLLRTVPAGATVLFDTYHQNRVATEAVQVASLREWFYGTVFGRSLLLALALFLIFLILQGQRLGPPLATSREDQPLAAAEFVAALANLQRRAHLRSSVAQHHKRRLKLALGRNYEVPADLADAEFLAKAQMGSAGLNPQEAASLQRLFARLDQKPDEAALVRLVAEVDATIAQLR